MFHLNNHECMCVFQAWPDPVRQAVQGQPHAEPAERLHRGRGEAWNHTPPRPRRYTVILTALCYTKCNPLLLNFRVTALCYTNCNPLLLNFRVTALCYTNCNPLLLNFRVIALCYTNRNHLWLNFRVTAFGNTNHNPLLRNFRDHLTLKKSNDWMRMIIQNLFFGKPIFPPYFSIEQMMILPLLRTSSGRWVTLYPVFLAIFTDGFFVTVHARLTLVTYLSSIFSDSFHTLQTCSHWSSTVL